MKTYRNLYPQVVSWHNLFYAWRKARKGKRRKSPAADFVENITAHPTCHSRAGGNPFLKLANA